MFVLQKKLQVGIDGAEVIGVMIGKRVVNGVMSEDDVNFFRQTVFETIV